MYHLITELLLKVDRVLAAIDSNGKDKEELLELKSELHSYSGKVFGLVDISIREGLRQRGITLIKNVYTGFDTEYKKLNTKYNKILSAQ